MSDLSSLLGALHFAARKHRKQRRKDPERVPYINHPIALADLLTRFGVDDVLVLQAALLHDTVEDTDATEEELRREFGDMVADVVMEVTDDKSLKREERMELQVTHATSLSREAKLVKIADKTCNILDLAYRPPWWWSRKDRKDYFDWTNRVIDGCRGVHAGLEKNYDEVLKECYEAVGKE